MTGKPEITADGSFDRLAEIFVKAVEEKFSQVRMVTMFAVCPATSQKKGIPTRAEFAEKLADEFLSRAPLSEKRANLFRAYIKRDVIMLADQRSVESGANLHDLMDLDAPYTSIRDRFREVMMEVSQRAAHYHLLLDHGKNRAANENIPGSHGPQ